MCSAKPAYGFRFDAARNGLVVHEREMAVVEEIFRLAADGLGPGLDCLGGGILYPI